MYFRQQSYAKQDETIHPPEQLFACILAEKWVCSTQLCNGCWVAVKSAPSHLVVHLLTPGVPFVPLSSFTAFARQFLPPQFLQLFYKTSSLITVWLYWRTVPHQLQLDLHTAIWNLQVSNLTDSIMELWQVYGRQQQLKITHCVNGTIMEIECISYSSVWKKAWVWKMYLERAMEELPYTLEDKIHSFIFKNCCSGSWWFWILFQAQDRKTSWVHTHMYTHSLTHTHIRT